MQPSTPEQKRVAMSLLTADRDIGLAQIVLQNAPHYYEGIGFHCQQAVEKYLKAALVASGLPAPFTHDLTRPILLLEQAGVINFSPQQVADAATLNEFAVELRYETDDAPAYTSAALLQMAQQFQQKLRPLAQAFLT